MIVCGTLAGSLGCMVFYMVLLISAYRCRQLMSSILFPYLTTRARRCRFSFTGAATRKSGVLVAFGAIALISYITGHCTVVMPSVLRRKNGQIVRVNRHSERGILVDYDWNRRHHTLSSYAQSLQPLQTVSILAGLPLCA